MKRFYRVILPCVAMFLFFSVTAHATIITEGHYRLGEDDPGAVADGNGNATTVDFSGNGNLTLGGSSTPTYSSSVAASAASATGSILSMDFGTGGSYYHRTPWTSATDNFGVEGWFKTTTPTARQALVYNGNMTLNGFGLYITGDTQHGPTSTHLMGLMGGIAWLDSGYIVTANEWFYAAMVKADGVVSFYINDNPAVSLGTVGTNAAGDGGVIASAVGSTGDPLLGAADNVRVFTFASGQFQESDLLINQIVPEPSALVLLGASMIGLLAYAWRKRR